MRKRGQQKIRAFSLAVSPCCCDLGLYIQIAQPAVTSSWQETHINISDVSGQDNGRGNHLSSLLPICFSCGLTAGQLPEQLRVWQYGAGSHCTEKVQKQTSNTPQQERKNPAPGHGNITVSRTSPAGCPERPARSSAPSQGCTPASL